MARHNPETVLSARMAALPFAGLREAGRLVAIAGTIGVAGDTALIGHFLTVPEARGRGLTRRLALHLRWLFAQSGVTRLLLATTDDNRPACRAYAAAGFSVSAWRWQVGRDLRHDAAGAEKTRGADPPGVLKRSPSNGFSCMDETRRAVQAAPPATTGAQTRRGPSGVSSVPITVSTP